MELDVQKVFKNNTVETALKFMEEIGIDTHFETSLVSGKTYLHLDYNIFADKKSPIVKECRGLALESGTWNIVRYGLYRFMNIGEEGCDIPFNDNVTVYEYEEKADGSNIVVSFFEDRWVAGSRGRIFPTEKLQNGLTFEEMFWKIAGSDKKNNCLNKSICYTFELCSMFNRIVIPYKNEQLVLLNARNKDLNWKEFESTDLYAEYRRLNEEGIKNLRRPIYYFYTTIEDCIKESKTLSGFEEGFVVKKWNPIAGRYDRAKVKGPAYLDLHHVITGFSLTNLMRMVLNKNRCYLETFPEQLETYDMVEKILEGFKANVIANYSWLIEKVQNIEDEREKRKQYAKLVKEQKVCPIFEGILFNLYYKEEDVLSILRKNLKEKAHLKKMITQLSIKDRLGEKWDTDVKIDDVF